ncbi:MAG TPA: HPr family phosphocarrier protein [Chitinispirillaceae bacterium]|nr:HPr family phosphocarrier protein [Chitinispirillaceae bacterium]
MVERSIIVSNTLGIHARPASLIVKTATKFKSEIILVKDGASADAKSIMNVMILAAAYNSEVVIKASGEDENEAADAIAALFEHKFYEE